MIVRGIVPGNLTRKWNYASFSSLCGDSFASAGVQNHILSILMSLSPREREYIDTRMQQVHGTDLGSFVQFLRQHHTVASIHQHMEEYKKQGKLFTDL